MRSGSGGAGRPGSAPSCPDSGRGKGRATVFLFGSSGSGFTSCLVLSGASLSGLLAHGSFVFDVFQVLSGALPVGIQDETLIVLGLGKNAGPGVEQG